MAGSFRRLMDWFANRPEGVALTYNYWTREHWQQAIARLDLRIADWDEALGLYPTPASWLFERSLHFVARLDVP